MHFPLTKPAYQYARCCSDAGSLEQNDRFPTTRRMGVNTLRSAECFVRNEAPEKVQNEAQLQCAIEACCFV